MLVPEGEGRKGEQCGCGGVCVKLSSAHRSAFTGCCTQHFFPNTHLELSPAHPCKAPDQTRLLSCKAIRKAEPVLSSRSGNSCMLTVCSPSFTPQQSPHKLNPRAALAGDKCVLCGVAGAMCACMAPGQAAVAEMGTQGPGTQAALPHHSPDTGRRTQTELG